MEPFTHDGSNASAIRAPAGWRFDDPPNLACISLWRVFEERRLIATVYHDADGGWQFLDGQPAETEDACVVGLVTALQFDASLNALFDLPRGWGAWRDSEHGVGTRFQNTASETMRNV